MQYINEQAIVFAQGLSTKPVFNMKKVDNAMGISKRTAYRRLHALKELGIAKGRRGSFVINTAVASQSVDIVQKLLPSITALNKGRRFGRTYNQSDINFALNNIQDKMVTLDHRAWELTKFQYPQDLYLYVKDVDETSAFLKSNGFYEGRNGRVILLPKIGDLSNEIERVYLDSIAKGGRSMLDAIAIEVLYGNSINTRGRFTTEDILKVREDLPPKQPA